MALNFPTNTNLPYVDPVSGLKYIYNNAVGAWETAIQPPAIVASTAPALTIPGFLWWDDVGGSLYIYYDDGDSQQWVISQPIGMWPQGTTATDEGIGVDVPTTQEYLHYGGDNQITISTMAPSQRADGTPNKMGDLWWSNQTGIMYIWYSDALMEYVSTGAFPEESTSTV